MADATVSVSECDEAVAGLNELWGQLSEIPGAVPEGVELNNFVCADEDVETTGELVNADIIADLPGKETSNYQDSAVPLPTCSDALKALDVVRRYCATIEGSGLNCSKCIDTIAKCVLSDAVAKKKHKTICDYFVK